MNASVVGHASSRRRRAWRSGRWCRDAVAVAAVALALAPAAIARDEVDTVYPDEIKRVGNCSSQGARRGHDSLVLLELRVAGTGEDVAAVPESARTECRLADQLT